MRLALEAVEAPAETLAANKKSKISKVITETLNVQFLADKIVFSKFRQKLKYHDIVARDFLNYLVVQFVGNDKALDKMFNDYLLYKFDIIKRKSKKSQEAALKNIKGTFDELDKEALYDLINQELESKDE